MKFLITAGPTREPIDPVRFLSNRSSGKMGYAVAAVARERGHSVRLVSGPVSLDAPAGVEVIRVTTAEEMLHALRGNVAWADALVMAAAVADWRPAEYSKSKVKKTAAAPELKLVRTPDILMALKALKGGRLFIGFAAETERLVEEAERKLMDKDLDLIVANDVTATDAGFESDDNRVVFVSPSGEPEKLPLMPKRDVALRIVTWAESRLAAARRDG